MSAPTAILSYEVVQRGMLRHRRFDCGTTATFTRHTQVEEAGSGVAHYGAVDRLTLSGSIKARPSTTL